jgi:hypothetical protein
MCIENLKCKNNMSPSCAILQLARKFGIEFSNVGYLI